MMRAEAEKRVAEIEARLPDWDVPPGDFNWLVAELRAAWAREDRAGATIAEMHALAMEVDSEAYQRGLAAAQRTLKRWREDGPYKNSNAAHDAVAVIDALAAGAQNKEGETHT